MSGAAATGGRAAASAMANRPLFIIDSDEASNATLRDLLAPQGFDVTTYAIGKEGLAGVQGSPPVLVVLALELSDMSGYVVCKKIKEDSATSGVPVIIVSRDATEKDFERHRKLKVAAQDYLRKPFENSELLRMVENLVGFNISSETYESLEAKIDGIFEKGTTQDEIKLKEKEVERLQREMEALRDELLRAKEQLVAKGDDEISAKLLAAESERDKLTKRVRELEAGGGAEALQAKLDQVTNERDELTSKFEMQIGELQTQLDRSQSDAAVHAEEIGRLEARLGEYQAELDKQIEAKKSLDERLRAELDQLREELNHAEEEASGVTARLEKREAELLQELEGIREQTEMMREDYERRLSEMREGARRALEEGLAVLNS